MRCNWTLEDLHDVEGCGAGVDADSNCIICGKTVPDHEWVGA